MSRYKPGAWVRVRKPRAADGPRCLKPGERLVAWVPGMDRFDGALLAVESRAILGYFLHGGDGYIFAEAWLEPAPTPSVYVVGPNAPEPVRELVLCYGCRDASRVAADGTPSGWLRDADGRPWCSEACWGEWALSGVRRETLRPRASNARGIFSSAALTACVAACVAVTWAIVQALL